jgi:hypothetical protein
MRTIKNLFLKHDQLKIPFLNLKFKTLRFNQLKLRSNKLCELPLVRLARTFRIASLHVVAFGSVLHPFFGARQLCVVSSLGSRHFFRLRRSPIYLENQRLDMQFVLQVDWVNLTPES